MSIAVTKLTQATLLATSSGKDLPPRPGLDDFFPRPFIFDGTFYAIDRVMMVRIICVIALVVIFGIYAKRAKFVPGRAQSTVELVFELVDKNIAQEVMGPKLGRRYLPLLTIIFVGVFAMNLTGVLPGLNIAATSVVGMPLIFAVFAYIAFIYAGIKEHGLRYFKNSLAPDGIPKLMLLLFTPIEFISTFVVRPVTLTIRLLANMVAGHILLAICFWGTSVFLFYLEGPMRSLAVATFLGSLLLTVFELIVAGLQAYIFALLAAVYIKLSVEE